MLLNHTECCNRKIVAFLRYGKPLWQIVVSSAGGVGMMQRGAYEMKARQMRNLMTCLEINPICRG